MVVGQLAEPRGPLLPRVTVSAFQRDEGPHGPWSSLVGGDAEHGLAGGTHELLPFAGHQALDQCGSAPHQSQLRQEKNAPR